MAAIPEARRALEDVGLADEIDLVVAGGIRNGGDIAKCIALGAKAVAIGHSALMALNCNKEIPGVTDYMGTMGVPAGECYHCHTGRCPVGITTQDPELRKRLDVEEAAERVYNFLHTLTLEVQLIARACGKTNVHSLEPEDLAALTLEAAAMAKVPLTGTEYIPGVTEERSLARIERLLERHLESPIDGYVRVVGANGQTGRRWHERREEPEKIFSIDAEYLVGAAVPVPGGHRRSSRTSTCSPRRPGEDINWLEDVTLLVEDGVPAVFDRYSNSFLKIYFPIPEGREDEIARKVLICHLQSGNSYGIVLKARAREVPPAGARAHGSRARRRSGPTGSRRCSRAGRRRRGTDPAGGRARRGRSRSDRPRTIPSGVMSNSRISGSWALARDLRTVTVRRRRDSARRYCSRMTLSERCEMPYSARRPTWKRSGISLVMIGLMPSRDRRCVNE